MAGYSGTPLAKRLGIKQGARVLLLSAPGGFVDNKSCAVDEIWSGLRFVVRLRDRGAPRA